MFAPTKRHESVECVLLIDNAYYPIGGVLSGVGDAPQMALDIPSPIVDFGLCRLGGTFSRTVNVLNEGLTGLLNDFV